MRTITILLTLMFLNLAMPAVQAQQESVWDKIERLEKQREQIKVEEKAALKKKVEKINQQREDNKVSREEARKLKEEAAKEHAMNIENRVAIIDNQIALLSRGDEDDGFNSDGDEEEDTFWHGDSDSSEKRRYNRTTTSLIVAAGFNSALQEGQSINDSDFKLAESRFFEIGLDWKTRVFNNSNWLRFRYGVSFQFNGLKPTDNRYFVENEDLTQLQEYSIDLEKSKFRMDNLVIPVHFEFGPSVRQETDSKVYFSDEDKFRIGLGGYAGLNIGERQKLKYSHDGDKVKVKNKNDFNTNNFVYGLSAYIGWGGTSLYGKYDLNSIFKEPNAELNNFSLGLRFDLN